MECWYPTSKEEEEWNPPSGKCWTWASSIAMSISPTRLASNRDPPDFHGTVIHSETMQCGTPDLHGTVIHSEAMQCGKLVQVCIISP